MSRAALLMGVSLLVTGVGCGPLLHRTATFRVYRWAGDPGSVETASAPAVAPPRDVFDSAGVATQLRDDAPEHLILITHGSDRSGRPDRWLFDCKDKIFRRTGLADPRLRVIVYDWAEWSTAGITSGFLTGGDQTVRPYTFLSAQLAAALLLRGGHLHRDHHRQHIHLILHSRGASIGSLLARLLGEAGIPVDHMTLLDGLDTLHPHADLDRIGDPPLAPERATWTDSYYCDGFWVGGLIDFQNYFVYGNRRRAAQVNVHFSHLRHVTSHDVYMGTIDDPSISWGWQWTALGGGWDMTRRHERTWELATPQLRIEGTLTELFGIAFRVWYTPADGGPTVLLWEGRNGPSGRFLRPGRYRVELRRIYDGRPVPTVREQLRRPWPMAGSTTVAAAVTTVATFPADEAQEFGVGLMDLNVEHVVRPLHPGQSTPATPAPAARPPR